MPFSEFSRFGNGFRFSSRKPTGQAIYESMRESQSGSFEVGGAADATLFADAMAIARCSSTLERAANQADPLKCYDLLRAQEIHYGIVVPHDATLNERRQALAAKQALARGPLRWNVEYQLRTALGDDFVAWVRTPAGTDTSYPAEPWSTVGNFGNPPHWTRVRLTESIADLTNEHTPQELDFSEVEEIDPFDLLPAALVFVDEAFAADTSQFTAFTEGTPGTFTFTNGNGKVDHTAGERNNILVTGADLTMPQVMVEIEVLEQTGTVTTYDNIGVGICKDANNFIFAGYDRILGDVRIQTKIAGSNNFNAGVSVTLTFPCKLGLSIIASSAVVWKDVGNGWERVTAYDLTPRVNMKTLSLTGWKAAFTVATHGGGTWLFDNLKAGRFGSVGLRDITIVTEEDGTPHVEDGIAHFLGTATDSEGAGYMGVFSIDLATHAIAQTGAIMVSRGGATQNDLAGHLIWYANGDRRLFVSTWGNGIGGVLQILHKLQTGVELLTGSRIVASMSALALDGVPSSPAGAYDPFAIKFGSTWYVAYTVTENTDFVGSPFYPALDTSSNLSTFVNAGDDAAARPYEGTRLVVADQRIWLLTGSTADARIYDDTMALAGILDAPLDGDGGLPVHPMVFPYGTKEILITFDNTEFNSVLFTIGHVKIYEAERYRDTRVHWTHIGGEEIRLSEGDRLVVEPYRLGCSELVTLTETDETTLTANFTKAHEPGSEAILWPWPDWSSQQKHSLVVVPNGRALDAEIRAKVADIMNRLIGGTATWDVVEESLTPGELLGFVPGVGKPGITPIQILSL